MTTTTTITLTPTSIERSRREFLSRVVSAVNEEASDLFSATQAVVPVISGKLKASGEVSPAVIDPSTGAISATVSYSTIYAARVHELPTGQHPKYIEGPLAELAHGLMERIASKVKS